MQGDRTMQTRVREISDKEEKRACENEGGDARKVQKKKEEKRTY